MLRNPILTSFLLPQESEAILPQQGSIASSALDSRFKRPLKIFGVAAKRIAPTVILNGAQRSEESNAFVHKTTMHLMSCLGFFAALRMTLNEG